jgi:hypothetical protein
MIRTDEALAVQQKLLGNVERALESLRERVLPKNPRNFEMFSEAYVDEINLLKAEINEYLVWKRSQSTDTNGTIAKNDRLAKNTPGSAS